MSASFSRAGATDLFGDSVRPNIGLPGRPRHTPTRAQRARVAELHREGLSQPAIAKAIGVTIPTLVLHYHREVESSSQAWRRHAADQSNDGE